MVNLLNEAKQFVKHLRKLDENSQFVPTYFEKAFGEKYNLKGLPLTDKISLNGKVDRIDIFKDHFRIIDYKSGNANASLEELYYGKKLQLFLYSLAIKNATGKILSGTFYLPIKNEVGKVDKDENLYKLMGFYTNDNNLVSAYDKNLEPKSSSEYVNMSLTKDGEIKKTEKVLTPSEMDKLLNYAKQISVNAINEISNGVFKASPLRYEKNKTTCDYCPYLTLCSKSSNNIAFRKVNKVDINSFEGGEDNA